MADIEQPMSDAGGDTGQSDGAQPDGQDDGGGGLDVVIGDAEQPKPAIIYAHNDTTLYRLNPQYPDSLEEIGDFDCLDENNPAMTDLAVDEAGKLYGVASAAIFLDMKVDETQGVVHCKVGKVAIEPGTVGDDAHFYGLTFAPPTPQLGSEESLIAANAGGDLYRIDLYTGELTLVGRFGTVPTSDGSGHTYAPANVGKAWELSGDMVFLTNDGEPIGFATLRDCPNPPYSTDCSRIDTLVEIDVNKLAPVTAGSAPVVTKAIRGQVLPADGCTADSCLFGSMYGIAAYNDKVYGFSRKGYVVELDNGTGQGMALSSPLSSPGFAGAGVTTLAPVIVPPPK